MRCGESEQNEFESKRTEQYLFDFNSEALNRIFKI